MNQFDWERIHEDVQIADVAPFNASAWSTAKSEYAVDVGTRVSGTYSDTQAVDNQYESFTEALNWWNSDYAYRKQITIFNHASSPLGVNYSICVTTDTSSLVSGGKILQSGNDLRIVYLSGSVWVELDRDVNNMNTASTQVWFKAQKTIGPNVSDNGYFMYYGYPYATSPPANKRNVYLWFDDFNRPNNPDITTESAYSVKTGGGTWSIEDNQLKNTGAAGDPNKLIITALGNVSSGVDMLAKIRVISFAGGDTSRMGLSCSMDTSPSRGSGYCGLFHEDTNSLDLLNDLRSWGTYGTYGWSLNISYYMRFRVTDPSTALGKVKVWQAGSAEPSTWTVDANFGSGTARGYGEVGFAGSRASDTTFFDDIKIRYVVDPEPSVSFGMEETRSNNGLNIDNTFAIDLMTYPLDRIKTVEVQMRYRASDSGEKWYLKAYNWSASNYDDNNFNSSAGQTPTTSWEYYAVNLTDRWRSYVQDNGTMRVEVIDDLADVNQTTFDIDFLGVRAVIDGAQLTLDNKGSTTAHLISFWVDNETIHQRYEINLFINSGEQASYVRVDITLPDRPFIVRIVTEKGTVSVLRVS